MQDRTRHDLADLLRTRRQQIIAAYEPRVRSLSPARDLPRAAIVDHLPFVLDRIASIIESGMSGQVSLGGVGRDHAVDRLARGFELEHLIQEYCFLRESIFEEWEKQFGATIDVTQARLLNRSFDECLRDAAIEYAALRGRVLRAVNRLSEAAFGPGDLDSFLKELIRTTIESMEDVDTAAILLVEDGRLKLRATSGLEEELGAAYSLEIGEGFSGRVAELRQPIALRNASEDPLVKSSAVRSMGLHALYGVPLLRGEELLGVAHIGSLTANEFSQDDRLLFNAMANRAASVIAKARLHSALQAALRTREQVLAIVSHDLRNHLGVFRMTVKLLETLARRGDLAAMHKPIETIDRNAAAMRRLVDDLLDMAALEAGRISIIPREVDLKQILEEACEPQVAVAQAKGVHLECPVVPSVEVYADPERVMQVLGNLLGNAVKFCGEGDSVTLLADTRPDEVLVSVRDNGPGITGEELAHLFEPYRAVRRSGQRPGTGLGLFIAKGIVEGHGGRIWVETDAGRGTTFNFTLPRNPPRIH